MPLKSFLGSGGHVAIKIGPYAHTRGCVCHTHPHRRTHVVYTRVHTHIPMLAHQQVSHTRVRTFIHTGSLRCRCTHTQPGTRSPHTGTLPVPFVLGGLHGGCQVAAGRTHRAPAMAIRPHTTTQGSQDGRTSEGAEERLPKGRGSCHLLDAAGTDLWSWALTGFSPQPCGSERCRGPWLEG